MTSKCKTGAYTLDPGPRPLYYRTKEKKNIPNEHHCLYIDIRRRKKKATGIEYVTNLLFTFVFISIGHQHDNETPSKQCIHQKIMMKGGDKKKNNDVTKPSASQRAMSVKETVSYTQTCSKSM